MNSNSKLAPADRAILTTFHARAVDVTGIAQALDLLAENVTDSKGLRFAFCIPTRLMLERSTELETAIDLFSMHEGKPTVAKQVTHMGKYS